MMGYNVLFIDEEETQLDLFKDYFEAVYPEIEPSCEFPLASLGEMLGKIDDLRPDAIVTDYQLNEIKIDINYTVKYNGIELIKAIREQREDFPCFVITSFDDEAVNGSDDVNMVYIKDILKPDADRAKVTFAERIKLQIDKYRSRIENAKQELSSLLEKRSSGTANVFEEDRIIKLDSYLENALCSYDSIPSGMKKLTNLERLSELIDRVDFLLEKLP